MDVDHRTARRERKYLLAVFAVLMVLLVLIVVVVTTKVRAMFDDTAERQAERLPGEHTLAAIGFPAGWQRSDTTFTPAGHGYWHRLWDLEFATDSADSSTASADLQRSLQEAGWKQGLCFTDDDPTSVKRSTSTCEWSLRSGQDSYGLDTVVWPFAVPFHYDRKVACPAAVPQCAYVTVSLSGPFGT